MRISCAICVCLAVLARSALAQEPPELPRSFPIETSAEEVYEFEGWSIEFRRLRLEAESIVVIPISCELGVTGAVLIGNGMYRFTPEDADPIEGQFRSALLRFNPDDSEMLIPLDEGAKIQDHGAHEMGRLLLRGLFSRFWYAGYDGGRRQEALIPPKGELSAAFYSKEHGDLIISGLGSRAIVRIRGAQTLYSESPLARDK